MTNDLVAGVLLAGGQSLRMGAPDKMLRQVRGQSLLERVVQRVRPQVGPLLLNANGDPARFGMVDLPVLADLMPGFQGPLAGIWTGMRWALEQHPQVRWIASFPTDTPLLPGDLVVRLVQAVRQGGGRIALARSGGRSHPAVGLWPVDLADDLHAALLRGERKIDRWAEGQGLVHVDWPDGRDDPFFNINTREDLVRFGLILDGGLSADPPLQSVRTVAVLARRQVSAHPWGGAAWTPLDLVFDPPPLDRPRMLAQDESGQTWLLPAPSLHLYRSDLSSYRYNLEGERPCLYVALRPEGEGVGVVMVTAAPDEAQTLLENNEDIVEPIPMAEAVQDWIMAFTAQHPPEPTLKKRKRQNYDPGQAGFGRRSA